MHVSVAGGVASKSYNPRNHRRGADILFMLSRAGEGVHVDTVET